MYFQFYIGHCTVNMDRKKYLVPYTQEAGKWMDFYSKQADTQSKAQAMTKSVKQENVNVKMITPVAQIPVEAKELIKDQKNDNKQEAFAPIKVKFPRPEVISAQATEKTTSPRTPAKRKQAPSKKTKKAKKSKSDILN